MDYCIRGIFIVEEAKTTTAKNTVISPNFWYGNFVERSKSAETMRKLCLSTKFAYQEIC